MGAAPKVSPTQTVALVSDQANHQSRPSWQRPSDLVLAEEDAQRRTDLMDEEEGLTDRADDEYDRERSR